jgi:hypothetical protein
MARRASSGAEAKARLVRVPTDTDLARMYAELAARGRVGRYDARTRREILAQLVLASPEGVMLADYLERIDGSISRQMALSDFHAIGLRTRSHGPGARWTSSRRRRRS